jgi:hypothetical protein
MSAQCVRCGRAVPDDGFVCHTEAQELAEALQVAAGHAEDAATLNVRAARYTAGGRGGSGDAQLPDLTRSARYDRAANAITGWARIAVEETGRRPKWRTAIGPLCPPTGIRCDHDSCEAIRRRTPPDPVALAAAWLAQQTGWLRRHPAAGEAFAELHTAAADLARLVDVPPDRDLVGMCDCGRVLYAERDVQVIRCPEPTCKLRWNVDESREILRRALRDKLVDAADAARLAAHWDERTSEQIRKLINAWTSRGQLVAHGWLGDEPVYRFGDVVDRLARTPKRERRAA